MNKHPLFLTALCLLFLSSCATYHISTESLLKQFAHSREVTRTTIFLAPPFIFFPGRVSGNNMLSIKVLDENEQEKRLWINNHTGIRITQKSGKKTTFYFNTLLLEDSTIVGSKTHFFNAKIRPIKFENITKIELQK